MSDSMRPDSSPAEIEPDVRFAFILTPSFTLLPFAGFVDAVRHSADEADRSRQIFCTWEVLSHDLEPVTASSGMSVVPWRTYREAGVYDYVVVVGGLLSDLDKIDPRTFAYLQKAHGRGTKLVGLCTGSFTLAKAGLLDGRRCAIHAHHRPEFVELFPDAVLVENEIYVDDGNIITCPGGTAAIDLAVEILIEHCGKSRGLKGLTAMVVDEHRQAHDVGRMPYQDLEDCGNWRVAQAVRIMRQKLREPDTTERLAETLGTTVRQLNRAFRAHAKATPQEIWRDMRLQHARWRLINSKRTITQIAHECGFADSSHFSRWFKREFGESPRTYKEQRIARVR